MTTMSSLDTNQKIYIDEKNRNKLFDKIINGEYNEEYAFNTECLERYCLGKTYLPDYAYSHIRSLLKKEFKQYKLDKGIKDKPKFPKNNKKIEEKIMRKIYVEKEPTKYTKVGHTYYLDTDHSLLVDLTMMCGKGNEPTTLEEFDKLFVVKFKPEKYEVIK